MEGLLTPVSTTYKTQGNPPEISLVEVPKASQKNVKPSLQAASTPTEALEILKNEPDYETLISTLRFLTTKNEHFNIISPSPIVAQLIHVLVSETVPTYWHNLFDGQKKKISKPATQIRSRPKSDLELLLSCLQSVPGVSVVLLSLKQHIQQSKETEKATGGPKTHERLETLLQLLQALLEGRQVAEIIWVDITKSGVDVPKQKALWSEFLGIIASGKLLGIAAEAEDVMNELSSTLGQKHWIADGSLYSTWLATNISYWARNIPIFFETGWKECGELVAKSFRLGHTEIVVKELINSLVLKPTAKPDDFTMLLDALPTFVQKALLQSLLQIISQEHLSTAIITEDNSEWWQADASTVSAAAGLIDLVIANDESRKNQMISWLTSSSGAGVGDGIAIRRAIVAALAGDKNDIEKILDRSLQQFADQLYIRHTPIMQQEVHTQVLLLAAGYVQRKAPLRLTMMMRSGAHLSAVSNRLAASSPRARFLGMAVGEALSSLVDKPDKQMDFKVEEISTPEAKWYKSLVKVIDTIGSLEPLMPGKVVREPKRSKPKPSKSAPTPNQPAATGSKVISIVEIETEEEEEEDSDDDGLVPYAKPDSDVEDSDEDATLITRNKPTAPVYIRDLIAYLRDNENYDRQKLALQTASSLIRRKANFGTEVSVHAEELASLLVGIQDKYDIENFQDMRIQGMIAVLVALPEKMGPWFSKTFFDGDYSIAQRVSVLTTLGLAARELGGYGAEDKDLTTMKALPSKSFPSKALPEKMHNFYTPTSSSPTTRAKNLKALPTNAIDTLSTSLQNAFISPIATALSKKTTPNVLRFNQTTKPLSQTIHKPKSTTTSNPLIPSSIFFPLLSFFLLRSNIRNHITTTHPLLLSLLIRTLSLTFNSVSPHSPHLPQMTNEFLTLLLGLRIRAEGLGDNGGVLEAVLFGFMVVVEANGSRDNGRGMMEERGREVLEVGEWVEGVLGRLGSGGGLGLGWNGGKGKGGMEEEGRVRMLAAGVLVRVREFVGKYQALLMGDLANFA